MIAEGEIDAKVSNISVSVELQNSLQTLSNGKVVPKFEVINSSCDLSTASDHLVITIHGNAFAEFVNILKTLVIGMVKDQLNTVLKE